LPDGGQTFPALVLNADFRPLSYFPLSLWSWQDAVKAVFLDRVSVLSEYETQVRSPSMSMRLPSVIALKDYIPTARRPAFTRFNVFLRDGFTCQYCSWRFPAHDLTFDHVVPQPWRPHNVGERRHRVRRLQSSQRIAAAPGVRDVPAQPSAPADDVGTAGSRPQLPAKLPARELAGLSLLGYRTRELNKPLSCIARARHCHSAASVTSRFCVRIRASAVST
jgi:hypothetical protein